MGEASRSAETLRDSAITVRRPAGRWRWTLSYSGASLNYSPTDRLTGRGATGGVGSRSPETGRRGGLPEFTQNSWVEGAASGEPEGG
jgi:hypothetical protein